MSADEAGALGLDDDAFMALDPSAVEGTAQKEPDALSEPVEEEVSVEPAVAEPTEDGEVSGEVEAALEPDAPINYEEEYKKVFAPFRANGKDFQVTSAEDALSLMQMGANYNKKMAALKPNLKLLKLLENNQLLSEDKISFLIDLDKKNPNAVGKLLKDSGIDPLDVDVSGEATYHPTNYNVPDAELALDAVIEEIQDTPTYLQTLDIVTAKWDGASKTIVADNPHLLKVINAQVASGVYDIVSKELERERMFGKLSDMTDIEAYRVVGERLSAEGKLGASPTNAPKPVAAASVGNLDQNRDKKRAASAPKAAVAAKQDQDFNPLALSDEEFSKQYDSRLM